MAHKALLRIQLSSSHMLVSIEHLVRGMGDLLQCMFLGPTTSHSYSVGLGWLPGVFIPNLTFNINHAEELVDPHLHLTSLKLSPFSLPSFFICCSFTWPIPFSIYNLLQLSQTLLPSSPPLQVLNNYLTFSAPWKDKYFPFGICAMPPNRDRM